MKELLAVDLLVNVGDDFSSLRFGELSAIGALEFCAHQEGLGAVRFLGGALALRAVFVGVAGGPELALWPRCWRNSALDTVRMDG